MLKTQWKLLAALAGCIVAAAACTSSNNGGSTAGGSAAGASNGSIPNTINIAIGAKPTGFDPFNDWGTSITEQVVQLYGGQLMTLAPDAERAVPQLAQSLTESADRKSWTAKLRPGLKFSDGTPLKASDVVASFNYAKNSAGPTGKFVLYNTVSSVTAPNDTTVVYHLKSPTSLIPFLLADPGSTIWPAADLKKGASFFKSPISAGKFKIDSFDPVSGRVELSANPNYYGVKPKVSKLVYTVVPDDGTRLEQLKNGTVDYAEDFDPTLKSQLTGDLHPETTISPGWARWFVFSDLSPITRNKNVRQAINLAINRQQIGATAFAGLATPLNGLPWNQASLRKTEPPIKQDVAKAKSLLAGTPCEHGCTIKVISPVTQNAPTDKVALVMQQQLRAIGIQLNIQPTPTAQVVESIKKPNFDAYDSTAQVGNPAPMTIALEEADPAADIYTSYALKYSSPRMHQLVAQMVSAPSDQIDAIGAKINAQFDKDLPFLSLVQAPTLYGSRLPSSVISVGLDYKLNIA